MKMNKKPSKILDEKFEEMFPIIRKCLNTHEHITKYDMKFIYLCGASSYQDIVNNT